MIEAESEAKANVALFEAQALDIRALKSADYPEILEYRFQQEVLEKIRNSADKLPQIIQMGDQDKRINYVEMAAEMLGIDGKPLFSEADIAMLRKRSAEINKRMQEREATIRQTATAVATDDLTAVEEVM